MRARRTFFEGKTMSIFSEIASFVGKRETLISKPSIEPYVNRIVHGDSIEWMRRLPDQCVDLIVTDPPYVTNYREKAGRKIQNDNNSEWIEPAFFEAHRLLKNDAFCVSFYGFAHADKFVSVWRACGFRLMGHFTFLKSYSSSVGYSKMSHECAYLLVKGKPKRPHSPPADVLPWKYTGNKIHPTQKPVSALIPLIDAYSKPGDIVLDPFGGSGSTAVAAKNRGRRFVLFEIEERFANLARARVLANKPE